MSCVFLIMLHTTHGGRIAQLDPALPDWAYLAHWLLSEIRTLHLSDTGITPGLYAHLAFMDGLGIQTQVTMLVCQVLLAQPQ